MTGTPNVLLKSSALRILHLLFNVISSFFMMPFVINSLGDRVYGIWILVGSFLSFYWLFDAGFGSATQRYVSKALAENNADDANQVINTSLAIFLVLGLSVLTFSFICGFTVPLFVNDKEEIWLVRKLLLLLGVTFAVGLPMRVFSGVLSAHLRFDLLTVVCFIKDILRIGLIIVFLELGYSIWALALITVGTDLFEYFSNFFLTKRIATYTKLSIGNINKSKFYSLFNYSWVTLAIQISEKLRFNFDSFIISSFLGVDKVTLYNVAWRLIDYLKQSVISALGLFIPVFSRIDARGDTKELQFTFLFITKISIYFTVFLSGCLAIFGRALIDIWLGESFVFAYSILLVLLAPSAIDFMQSPSIQLVYGISKHKVYLIINSIEGVLNLSISLILVGKYGLIGVALGTAIPMFVIRLLIQPYYVCKTINLGLKKYYNNILLCTFKASMVLICFYIIIFNIKIYNLLSISGLGLVLLIGYSITIYRWGFSVNERRIILSYLFRQ
jgi:O-antigen/teichoic acid export membrane protein